MPAEATTVPVIDIFAGPGGLGEGFSAFTDDRGRRRFSIGLSIEKDALAHRTLLLRSFFRQFDPGDALAEYDARLRGELTTDELFGCHQEQARAARHEAWRATLGDANESPLDELRRRVREAIGNRQDWVLIGGPPCQAYSLVGRSRNRGIDGYSLDRDPKARLYLEYLQLIGDF